MNRDTDDKTTDAEGHMPIKRVVTEAGTEDVVDEADTEGSRFHGALDETAPEADAEGHANPPGRPLRKN